MPTEREGSKTYNYTEALNTCYFTITENASNGSKILTGKETMVPTVA